MKSDKKIKEPSMVIKPIGRFGGLDNLHMSLIVVIVLLLLLLLTVSYGKPILINNTTNSTIPICNLTTGANCSGAMHSQAQIKTLSERILASYANVNSSLSLLPYISNISSLNAIYLQASKSWYVSLKAKNPNGNLTFTFAFLINDVNTSQITPLLQTVAPSKISNNTVVSTGVVQLSSKYVSCLTPSPIQVYWFIDPYALGAVKSLLNASNIMQQYGSQVNLTMKISAGSDTQRVGSQVGLANALYLSKYVLCASQQQNFTSFATNLNQAYSNGYVPQNTLISIANLSKLNNVQLNQCLSTSGQAINSQALLVQYYNITQTPLAVVNCHYLAIPQTVKQALCYVNSSLC